MELYDTDNALIISGTYNGYHYIVQNGDETNPNPFVYIQFSWNGDNSEEAFNESNLQRIALEYIPAYSNIPNLINQYAYVKHVLEINRDIKLENIMPTIKVIIDSNMNGIKL